MIYAVKQPDGTVAISGLDQDTQYNVIMKALDAEGNILLKAGASVDLSEQLDPLTGLTISHVDGNTTVSWTDSPAPSFDHVEVVYGEGNLDNIYGNVPRGPEVVVINTLDPDKVYWIGVIACDSSGGKSTPVFKRIVTSNVSDDEISNVIVSTASNITTISWAPPANEDYQGVSLLYGISPQIDLYPGLISGDGCTIEDLISGFEHEFTIIGIRKDGTQMAPIIVTHTPPVNTSSIEPVTDLECSVHKEAVKLEWRIPITNRFSRCEIWYGIGNTNIRLPGDFYETATIKGLTAGELYLFRVVVYDTNNNPSNGTVVSATPSDVAVGKFSLIFNGNSSMMKKYDTSHKAIYDFLASKNRSSDFNIISITQNDTIWSVYFTGKLGCSVYDDMMYIPENDILNVSKLPLNGNNVLDTNNTKLFRDPPEIFSFVLDGSDSIRLGTQADVDAGLIPDYSPYWRVLESKDILEKEYTIFILNTSPQCQAMTKHMDGGMLGSLIVGDNNLSSDNARYAYEIPLDTRGKHQVMQHIYSDIMDDVKVSADASVATINGYMYGSKHVTYARLYALRITSGVIIGDVEVSCLRSISDISQFNTTFSVGSSSGKSAVFIVDSQMVDAMLKVDTNTLTELAAMSNNGGLVFYDESAEQNAMYDDGYGMM